MHTAIVDTKKVVKSNVLKEWCVDKFENIVGQFPEYEEKKTEFIIEENKPLLKKYKTLRYMVFPIVFILIIIDESYIRIKECVKKIDKSE